MQTLKVGDRVRVNQTYEEEKHQGEKGTIASIDTLSWPIGVYLEGHVGRLQFAPHELDLLDENYHTEPPC
jgi:small-conductance mechanosensitive channel